MAGGSPFQRSWAAGGVSLVVALTSIGCTPSHHVTAPKPSQPSNSPAPATRPAPSARSLDVPAHPPYAVGVRHVRIVDPTRSTPPRAPSPAHRGRVLDTTFWYPT